MESVLLSNKGLKTPAKLDSAEIVILLKIPSKNRQLIT